MKHLRLSNYSLNNCWVSLLFLSFYCIILSYLSAFSLNKFCRSFSSLCWVSLMFLSFYCIILSYLSVFSFNKFCRSFSSLCWVSIMFLSFYYIILWYLSIFSLNILFELSIKYLYYFCWFYKFFCICSSLLNPSSLICFIIWLCSYLRSARFFSCNLFISSRSSFDVSFSNFAFRIFWVSSRLLIKKGIKFMFVLI